MALMDGSAGDAGAGAKGHKKQKGDGKGKVALPKGIKVRTAENKPVCYAYNKGEACVQSPCTMAHVCWFCHAEHVGGIGATAGKNCPRR